MVGIKVGLRSYNRFNWIFQREEKQNPGKEKNLKLKFKKVFLELKILISRLKDHILVVSDIPGQQWSKYSKQKIPEINNSCVKLRAVLSSVKKSCAILLVPRCWFWGGD